MASKGKGTGSGNDQGDSGGYIIEVTPEGGFDIRKAAHRFSRLMEELQQPLVIHLSHVSVEFEAGCTPGEIVDGYHHAMNQQIKSRSSNMNIQPSKKK